MADLTTHLWLVELSARRRSTLLPELLCWATSPGHQTMPGDDPAMRVYQPRIIDPGNTETHLFAPGATLGAAVSGQGEIRLNNADGGLDFLAGMMVDDGQLIIRFGRQGGRYPDDFPVQARGRCWRASFQGREVALRWVDLQADVMARFLTVERFGGTNVLPNGVDGVADDLAGKPKPEVWGDPGFRLPLRCVNTTRLIYQVSRRPVSVLDSVQDKGVDIPIEATEVSLAALEAATVTAGYARVFKGGGVAGAWVGAYVKLGSKPDGQVTVRAAEAATSLSDVLLSLLTGPGGVALSDIDTDNFASMAAAFPAATGWYLSPDDDQVRLGDAVTALCDGAGLSPIADALGRWRLVSLTLPQGLTPRLICDRSNILLEDFSDLGLNTETDGVPASQIILQYDFNWATATANELAETVAADQVARATMELRTVTATPRADQPVHATAEPMTITTRLRSTAAAQSRANVARDLYCGLLVYAVLPLPTQVSAGVSLGDEILFRLPPDPVSGAPGRWPDLGIDAGRPMVVIGRVDERRSGKTFLYCVG